MESTFWVAFYMVVISMLTLSQKQRQYTYQLLFDVADVSRKELASAWDCSGKVGYTCRVL